MIIIKSKLNNTTADKMLYIPTRLFNILAKSVQQVFYCYYYLIKKENRILIIFTISEAGQNSGERVTKTEPAELYH